MLVVKIIQRGCLNDPYLNDEKWRESPKIILQVILYLLLLSHEWVISDLVLELWVVSLSFKLYSF